MARPVIHDTPEKREAARNRARAKQLTISLDVDLIQAISASQDRLEIVFGFRPTHSQVIRHLLREALK